MSSNATPPRLDQDLYSGAAGPLEDFYRSLPEQAVRDLALEGFRRLAERRKAVIDPPVPKATNDSIERLCRALISHDSDESARAGEAILQDHSVEDFYLVYLSGAASRLGLWWDDDRVSFVEVTVGLGRLHALVRAIEHPVRDRAQRSGSKRAIFATVPGERHTLGVTMATDLFRRRGWHILLLIGMDHDELVSRITQADAKALGVSAGGAHAAAPLARLLLELRINRPDCRVFVSGQIVQKARSLVEKAMPDGIATNLAEAEELLGAFAAS
ncbi:MAG: cobalamin-dependent protein, partial [Pseudomonadota bacterium]